MNIVRKIFTNENEADLFWTDLEEGERIDSFVVLCEDGAIGQVIVVEFVSEETQEQWDNKVNTD